MIDHKAYVPVSWSNGRKFLTMTMTVVKWSILTIDQEQISRCHGHGKFFDHGVNFRVSWSVPYPPPPLIR